MEIFVQIISFTMRKKEGRSFNIKVMIPKFSYKIFDSAYFNPWNQGNYEII